MTGTISDAMYECLVESDYLPFEQIRGLQEEKSRC